MSIFDPPEVQFARKLDKNLKKLEYLDIEGLNEVIFEIRNLEKEGIYKSLIDAVKLKRKIYAPGAKYTRDEGRQIRLLMLGHQILSNSKLYLPSFMDLIHFEHFYVTFVFLERIYYMNSSEKLEREDLLNVNFSGLAEKIMFALDNFDQIEEIPKITDEVFLRLRKLNWQDDESKNLYNSFKWIMGYVGEVIFGSGFSGGTPGGFAGTEMYFTLFLAGCSAINCNRDEINQFDIVRAYKTYFKLLKTDITVYKADPDLAYESGFVLNKKTSDGYLICKRCSGYYKLEKGESPDYFTDKCECGGELEYKEKL